MKIVLIRWYNLWKLAIENLFRYKQKTLAIFIPLVLALTFFSIIVFVKDGLHHDAQLSLEFLPDLTIQKLGGGRIEKINLDSCKALQSLPQVKKIVPRVWGYVPITVGNENVAYTLLGMQMNDDHIASNISIALDQGRFLQPEDKYKAVVGKAVSKGFGIDIGEEITLTDAMGYSNSFEVVGIFGFLSAIIIGLVYTFSGAPIFNNSI